MSRFKTFQRTAVYITGVALLAACAAPNGQRGVGGDNQSGAVTQNDPCSIGMSAVTGALTGAVLGALLDGSKGAAKGALAGGVLGAATCVAINFKSNQTKSAVEADADYRKARGALPTEPKVVSYSTKLASNSVQRGQPLMVNSTLEMVNGTKEPLREVREELAIFNPDGTAFKSGSKPFSTNTAGRYDNTFEIKLPAGASQGVYALKTTVFVNGKLAVTRDLSTQVVWDGKSGILVASR
jgi:hypothetical protein